jgi:hypothetical protein
LERSLHRTDLAPPVGLTMAHAAVSEFDAEAWNPPFLPPQDSPPSIPHFQGFGRSSANWPVQSDVLNFAALSVLDVPAASSLPITFLFGYYFVRPQDAKLTGIRFEIHVDTNSLMRAMYGSIQITFLSALPTPHTWCFR